MKAIQGNHHKPNAPHPTSSNISFVKAQFKCHLLHKDFPGSSSPSIQAEVMPPFSECRILPGQILKGGLSIVFVVFFCLFRAAPSAYGGSQARGPIGAVATDLHQSRSDARSEPHLRPTPQLTQHQILNPLREARD